MERPAGLFFSRIHIQLLGVRGALSKSKAHGVCKLTANLKLNNCYRLQGKRLFDTKPVLHNLLSH